MTKRLLWLTTMLLATTGARAAEPAPAADTAAQVLEEQVAAIVADERVTIVRFWAPWCPNCRAEMTEGGWREFIVANPEVQFVFICIWHRDQDPAARLKEAGLGDQPNLTLLTHPGASSRSSDRLARFLDLPVTWIPTTWVFRAGKLRFAFNYGEMRFGLLQQLVDDSRNEWKH